MREGIGTILEFHARQFAEGDTAGPSSARPTTMHSCMHQLRRTRRGSNLKRLAQVDLPRQLVLHNFFPAAGNDNLTVLDDV